jgi:hypothetical protein
MSKRRRVGIGSFMVALWVGKTGRIWSRTEFRARSKSSNRIDPRRDLGELRWIAFYASDFHVLC